jgi:ABC-type transport system involved in multi-copper enzyme maturation permease subunit
MFWNLLVAEETKTFKRKIFWVELAIVVGLTILMLGSIYTLADQAGLAEQALWPNAFIITLQQFATNSVLTGLMIVVLVGAILAQEYTWRTLHMLLASGISRQAVLGAKFLAVLLPVLLLVVAPLLAGGIVSAILTVQARGALDPAVVNFGQLAFAVLYGAFTLLPYAALAFLLATISRSAVTTIGGGIGILLGESIAWQALNSLGGFGPQLAQWLPSGLTASLLSLSTQIASGMPAAFEQPPAMVSPAIAAVGILVYTVALLTIAGFAFQRQDLTA